MFSAFVKIFPQASDWSHICLLRINPSSRENPVLILNAKSVKFLITMFLKLNTKVEFLF